MKSIVYKGYEIEPQPYVSGDSTEWIVQVVISSQDGEGNNFEGNNVCETREEAALIAIEFGKQIVDGNYPQYQLS